MSATRTTRRWRSSRWLVRFGVGATFAVLLPSIPLQGQQQEPPPPPIPEEDLREPQQVLTGSDLVDDDFPGSWPMFGTDYRLKLSGYVKADFLYDLDGTLDRRQLLMSTIPAEGTPEHENSGYISLFAAETRFGIDVRRVVDGKPPLRLFVEGDFWPGGQAFRLRHAYMGVDDFVIGQTWTTLSILESLVTAIDFAAGDALFGGRTTQVRYQRRASDRWKFAVALESLDFMGIENSLDQPGQPSAALPVLAVRADYHWSTGLVVIGSSLAQLRWDGGAEGPDAKALQFDAVVGGRQYLGADFFTWNVAVGRGAGENIMAFAGSGANAVLTADGELETMPAFSVVLGFVHKWSATLVSNASFAYGWLDTPDSRAPLALKRGGIGHLNLIWRATEEFSAGVEWITGAQRTADLSRGNANRIQFMSKLAF